MKLSVVTTVFQSKSFIEEFYSKIKAEAKKITSDYELIFVNDGSPDDSIDLLKNIVRRDEKVTILNLSRNYGHHHAIMAGLNYSKGDLVFLIDIDLEEDPHLLSEFYTEIASNEDLDVVFGVQKTRKGHFTKKYGGWFFYKVFNLLANVNPNPRGLTIRIMKRAYVDALVRFKEKHLFLAGIFELLGFNTKSLTVDKLNRSTTSYSFSKRFVLMVTALTSFSSFPLVISFYFGLLLSLISFFYGTYLVIKKMIYQDLLNMGWTSLMVSIWFLGGVILMSTGIIGIYLSKIFDEIKNRPNYIVKEVLTQKGERIV